MHLSSFLFFCALAVGKVTSQFANTNGLDNIVYDVTNPLQDILDNSSFVDSLEDAGVHLSSNVFFKTVFRHYSDVPYNIAKYFWKEFFSDLYSTEVNLIFKREFASSVKDFLSDKTDVHLPSAIAIKIQDLSTTQCIYYCNVMTALYRVNRTIPGANKIKFGIAVNEQSLSCLMECSYVLQKLDIIVFNVEFFPVTTISTIGLFSQKMASILTEKQTFVKDITSKCDFILRVSMSEYPTAMIDQADIYRATINNHSQLWLKHQKTQSIIIDTFPKIVKDRLSLESRLNFSSPYLYDGEFDISSFCELRKLLQSTSPYFKHNFLGIRHQFYALRNESGCISSKNSLQIWTNLILKMVFQAEKAIDLIETVTNSLDVKMVYYEEEAYSSTELDKLWDISSSRNISLGCIQYVEYYKSTDGTFEHEIYMHCNKSRTPNIILEWRGEVAANHKDFQLFFDASLEYHRNFSNAFPNGKMFISLPVFDYIGTELGTNFRHNLYCSRHLIDVKEFYDSIVSQAAIHEVNLIAQPMLDTEVTTGWWYNLITEDELNRTISDFPVILRRNVPETLEGTNQLPFTQPCIYRNEILDSNVLLETNHFSGITINFNKIGKTTIQQEEIQTILLFALGKFASVEIVDSGVQLYPISTALNEDLQRALAPRAREVENLNVYFEITEAKLLQQNIWTFRHAQFAFLGFHLLGWETHGSRSEQNILVALKSWRELGLKIDFGITVQNCTHEINLGLQRIKSLDYIHLIKYIVCVVKPVELFPLDKKVMQKYLDTHFYIQQYFNKSLQFETFFRLNFYRDTEIMENQIDTENYLTFVNDKNQFSEGYNIKYFMGDAFSNKKDNLYSWWRLSEDNDLTKSSIYNELESEYFGRPTEQRFRLDPKTFKYIPLVVALSVVSVFLCIAVLSIWIYHRRMKQTFLTRDEVNAFRNGEEVQRNEESIGVQYIQVNTVKSVGFDDKFEIPKKNLELGDVIGEGNFGLVYKAILCGNTDKVAVKVPHEDCSKASFKSMLTEVKILCYIGSHPNVLSFIGACTKDIDKGQLCVVTEYCSNGSLESYLRALKPTTAPENKVCINYVGLTYAMVGNAVDEIVHINQLNRFAYEIACGMEYISGKKVVHADLSARNVLLTDNMICKIGDFGLSRKLYDSNEYIKKAKEVMPWKWLAVETLKKLEFTNKSDVWSFGVTLWEIFSLGDIPYSGVTWSQEFIEELENGLRMSKPIHATDEIYDQMLKCWNILPQERPTFYQISNFLNTYLLGEG